MNSDSEVTTVTFQDLHVIINYLTMRFAVLWLGIEPLSLPVFEVFVLFIVNFVC